MDRHIRTLSWRWIAHSTLTALSANAVVTTILLAGDGGQPAGEHLLVALLALSGMLGGIQLLRR